MASTDESQTKVELQADGENSGTWGQLLNRVITELSALVTGLETIAVTGGETTLTDTSWVSNQVRNAILKFTGTLTSNQTIIIPARSKLYKVWNATSGSYTLTVKTSGGTGAVIPQGEKSSIMCDGTDTYHYPSNMAKTGKQSLWIPASAMRPIETDGATALASTQISSGKPEAVYLAFDPDSPQYAEFSIAMPKSWNAGTITFIPYWTTNDVTTNSVVWALQGVSIADNDAIDATYGTAISVTDSNQGAAFRNLVGAESAAVTIAGSPAAGELQILKIGRQADDAVNDTLDADAYLLGIKLIITTNAGNDE